MFKQILLPTDGSELSARAVLAGVGFAKETGARVVGMTALPGFHTFTANVDMIESTEAEYLAASEARGNQNLASVANTAKEAGVPCSTTLVRSHGRRGIGAMLLGSETQKVLVHSAIPVLVYR